jgi:CheY-like chemotaxis protein
MHALRLFASSERPALVGPTVLIVEDHDLVRETIVIELQEAGYVVLEAVTGEEALRVLEAQPVHALFTDIRLPGSINGWWLAEAARKLDPAIPVIYASGYSDEAPRVVPGGVFVHKPYAPSTIRRELERLLAE